jgi:nitronate monooxygenase
MHKHWPDNILTAMLDLRLPLIQAPMAGGSTTPELVAAVSNAGALGSLAAPLLSPAQILDQCARIRTLTNRPFCVNLFVLEPGPVDQDVLASGIARLKPYTDELGLPAPSAPAQYCQSVSAQLEAVLAVRPALASFTFGVLSAAAVTRLREAGIRVMGTATNVAEALAWQEAGADLVCAQGAEAGGHRGTFIGSFEQSCVGLFALLPQIVDAVRVPVVAAGGIMDGRGIAASLMLGAVGAQLGTAFLAADEAGIHAAYKDRLAQTADTGTLVTSAFSGRPARAIANRFSAAMASQLAALPPYPVQNALTGPLRAHAAQTGQLEYMSLYAGQGAGMARRMPAAELVALLRTETDLLLGE